MSYKMAKLTERVIFRISKEEKEMIDSILKKGIYRSQSELFRGAMGVILFLEEKISLSEITNLYLRGSVQVMFSEIEAIENESKIKEQWKKMREKIIEAKKEAELEIKEVELKIKERELEIKEINEMIEEEKKYFIKREVEIKNIMKEERNATIKMMINFIDMLNEIPAGMKRRKLDFTKEGKLVKSLYINTKNKLEKLFLFYLRDSTKMSQVEIDELFEGSN